MQLYYQLVAPPEVDDAGHRYYGADLNSAASSACSPEGRAVWFEEMHAMAEDDEWCTYHDSLENAQRFRWLYAKCGHEFEIQGLCICESESDCAAIRSMPGYRGLDVSTTEPHSVLHPMAICKDMTDHSLPKHLLPFWELERRYFRPRLNKWGLLDNFADAVLLRDLTRAEVEIEPTLGTPTVVDVLGVVYMPLS